MSETIELLGYFSFFWLFLFNREFRAAQVSEWQQGGWLERAFILFEALVSFIIGAVVPAALVWSLL